MKLPKWKHTASCLTGRLALCSLIWAIGQSHAVMASVELTEDSDLTR